MFAAKYVNFIFKKRVHANCFRDNKVAISTSINVMKDRDVNRSYL